MFNYPKAMVHEMMGLWPWARVLTEAKRTDPETQMNTQEQSQSQSDAEEKKDVHGVLRWGGRRERVHTVLARQQREEEDRRCRCTRRLDDSSSKVR